MQIEILLEGKRLSFVRKRNWRMHLRQTLYARSSYRIWILFCDQTRTCDQMRSKLHM